MSERGQKPTLKKLTHDAYTIGWVCALHKEQTAAIAMLDEIHQTPPKTRTDSNTYTLGSIGNHNIVIACLLNMANQFRNGRRRIDDQLSQIHQSWSHG